MKDVDCVLSNCSNPFARKLSGNLCSEMLKSPHAKLFMWPEAVGVINSWISWWIRGKLPRDSFGDSLANMAIATLVP